MKLNTRYTAIGQRSRSVTLQPDEPAHHLLAAAHAILILNTARKITPEGIHNTIRVALLNAQRKRPRS